MRGPPRMSCRSVLDPVASFLFRNGVESAISPPGRSALAGCLRAGIRCGGSNRRPQKGAVLGMSSPASPPAVPPRARRADLGGIAFGLVIGILVAGVAALMADGAASRNDPLAVSLWPVNPVLVLVVTGFALVVPLVLAARAIKTERNREFGTAAIGVALLPECIIFYIVALVVAANWPWR